MRKLMLLTGAALIGLPALAPAQMVRPGPVQAIGPKQDDPRSCDGSAIKHKGGGLATGVAMGTTTIRSGQSPGGFNPETDPHAAGGAEAIGPKQDDPAARGLAIGPKQDDPAARGLAIGPKQDDPRKGIIVQGGRKLAIGPKQDDPRTSDAGAGKEPVEKVTLAPGGFDPETDPHAMGGKLAMSDDCGSGGQAPLPKPAR